MSIQLPGGLVTVLNLLGFSWPLADEDKLRESANAWRAFATTADDVRTNAAGVVRQMAQDNEGEDIDALVEYWSEFDGANGHLPNAAEAARLVAEVLDGLATVVEIAKGAVIVQLGITAAAIAATVGLGAAAALTLGRTVMQRVIIKELKEQGVEVLAKKLARRSKELFDPILRATRRKLDDVAERAANRLGARGPQPAFAGMTNVMTRGSGKAAATRAANVKKGIPPSKLGPSGKPKIHVKKHATKKQAKDAARNKGKGEPMHHPSPERGGPHYHPVDKDGKKIPGPHEEYPR